MGLILYKEINMKKILTLISFLVTGLASSASPIGQTTESGSKETVLFMLNALAILLVIYLASSFLLSLIRLFLGDRLRRTLLEKNASEKVIVQMLPAADSMRQTALQWCCVLVSAGIGLTISYFSQPLGFHSAIIMSFCLAAGLLVYYLISKPKSTKP